MLFSNHINDIAFAAALLIVTIAQWTIDEVNNSLVADLYVDDNGELHKVQGGGDTVLLFSGVPKEILMVHYSTGFAVNYLLNSSNVASYSMPTSIKGNYINCAWSNSDITVNENDIICTISKNEKIDFILVL